MKKVAQLLIAFAVGSAFLLGSFARAQETKFQASLSGKSEVPAVDSPAQGQATFQLSPDGKRLMYTLTVNGAADVTMAHIHLGEPGKDGKPVAPLYPVKMSSMSSNGNMAPSGDKKGMTDTVTATGTITAAKLVGPLQGKTIDDLVADIRAGKTYVNVHTKGHPDGEIRGTIQ